MNILRRLLGLALLALVLLVCVGAYLPATATLPINLAGGSGVVTGVLPTGNQASQAMGGDISGTTASATVQSISGTSPIVVTPNTVEWALATTNPLLGQQGTSGSAHDLSVRPQETTQNPGTGGNLNLELLTPVGAGGETYARVMRGSSATSYSTMAAMGSLSGGAGAFGCVYLGSNVTPSGTNFAMCADGSANTIVNAPSGSTLGFSVANQEYSTLTPTQITEYSGASIRQPWQGSVNTQTEKIQYIPFVARVSSNAGLNALYTYATTTNTMVTFVVHATFKTSSLSSNDGAAGCAGSFLNNAGTVSQIGTTTTLWGHGTSVSCNFNISGTNVQIQGADGNSGITADWQGLIEAMLD